MATPLNPERYQRQKEYVEAALRDGFDPYRQFLGGKGSATAEAARRMQEAGFEETRNTINDFVRNQEK